MSYWKPHYLGSGERFICLCFALLICSCMVQAWERALEEAIVPGCIVHAAVRRHAHWPQLRGRFTVTTSEHVFVSPLGVLCMRYRQCLEIATTGVMKLSCTRLSQSQGVS
jgi:hypothetical protein